MQVHQSTGAGMLRLTLAPAVDVDYVNVVAAMIREFPEVLRVRVELSSRQLEILYRAPANGMLQRIHHCLLAAGRELSALRAH
jgi:hypothetical protein